MNICLVVPIINEFELTKKNLKTFIDLADEKPNILIIDNGSKEGKFRMDYNKIKVKRYIGNIGLLPSLQKGYEYVKKNKMGDIILFTHNDVTMLEQGWDRRLLEVFENKPQAGIVGFGGAEGIGAPGIFRVPYEKIQLARQQFMSNMDNAEAHGWRRTGIHPVAVLDGFTLATKISTLDKIGGFDLKAAYHHMYDNDICLEAINHGFINYMVGVSCHHHGGITSTARPYLEWAKRYMKRVYKKDVENGDQGIHDEAHVYFYNKWKVKPPTLPYTERRI